MDHAEIDHQPYWTVRRLQLRGRTLYYAVRMFWVDGRYAEGEMRYAVASHDKALTEAITAAAWAGEACK
jgi:hypothetical protein